MRGGGGGRCGRGGGGGGEGRLTKALVDNRLATSASMGFAQLHDPGLVVASAEFTHDQSLDAAQNALLDTLAGVVTSRPTKEEVDRVKTALATGLEGRQPGPP